MLAKPGRRKVMYEMQKLPKAYYQDDYVTLYHGNAIELLPRIKADVMVTDPPYGYNYTSGQEGKWRGFVIPNDDSINCRDTVLETWGSKPAIVFGSWKRDRPQFTINTIIWDKGNCPGMGDLSMPWGSSHEEIYILGGGFVTVGKRTGSVIRFKNSATSQVAGRMHPNEKPLPLMRYLIERCPPGVIVDPFAGSGSTLRAAKDLGRKCIGIELDEQWLDVIARKCAQDVLAINT